MTKEFIKTFFLMSLGALIAVGVVFVNQKNKPELLESMREQKPASYQGTGTLRNAVVVNSGVLGSYVIEQGRDGSYHLDTYLAPNSTWTSLVISEGKVKSRVLARPAICGAGSENQAYTGEMALCY